ncbi:transport and Golgi organization protein 1 homolog isoform X1 [Sphaeramia orbicularis]|uniref:transport and Golgi organization protein 1 homolog isoform X1 n=1 Tax=Sphaeramia orbicularis TaxID=375764 RepID=UPI00117E5AE9|nr:transport and Golgi organization protein 1 homolog isoform X1 [Sphaeramia orbicularis]
MLQQRNPPVNKTASMAAKQIYRNGFLLLLFNFISTAALEKRFSDFKRCADEECSMLLCRGKAVQDFQGPDCRFLSFKKSETIYVYYKLSGKRSDMWAGSVGSHFGYFPKDYLAVNHLYTDKELEIPAEETDFVCFDTGFDKFNNYDIDSLLGSSNEDSDDSSKDTAEQIPQTENAEKETKPSSEEVTESEAHTEPSDITEDLYKVPDDESASLPEPDIAVESPSTEVSQSDAEAEKVAEDTENEQTSMQDSVLQHVVAKDNETKETSAELEESLPKDDQGSDSQNESVSVSEGVQIPELKTTLGTTFDAVTTDDETTRNVTPYEEEKIEESETHKDQSEERKETPLISFSEDNTPLSDTAKPNEPEDKSVWMSLGDAVFSVVTGGETTPHDISSDEDDDEDEDEEVDVFKTTKTFEETRADKKPIDERPPPVPESKEPAPIDVPSSNSEPEDDKQTVSDSEKLLFDPDNETEGEAIEHEEPPVEMVKPTDEQINQTEADHVPQENTESDSQAQEPDIKTTQEPSEDKEEVVIFKETNITDEHVSIEDKSITAEHKEDLDDASEENRTLSDQEPEPDEDLTTQEMHDSDVKNDDEKIMDDNLEQNHDHLVPDLDSDHQPELSDKEPELSEDPSEQDDEHKDVEEETEEQNEELLEDENALSFSQSDTSYTDSDKPEISPPPVSTPEPEYSDSIMRLTLLRDHFQEENMARFQKYLGLTNLFKVEAMFSDLDTELQATRQSHTGSTQDIETALEVILETSENAILDEIEKMLDSRDSKPIEENMDKSILDEETEILDDIQELAFSLRQKYSTASDTAPLAGDKMSDVHLVAGEGEFKAKEDVPHITAQEEIDNQTETESNDNLTVTHLEEKPAETEKESIVLDEVHTGPDVSVEEDSGHFNKNKDNQQSFSPSDEMQKVPQSTLENPLDMGLGVKMEHSASESLDSMEPSSEFHKEEVGLLSTVFVYMGCILSIMKSKTAQWTVEIISLLPEEWKPGENLFGCPWQAVVVTALVGVMTFTLFFWRTVLAVKKREYLVDDKKLTEQMQALKKEKNDALVKISELQKQTEHLKENQKQSQETVSCTMKRMQDLENKVTEAETLNEQMTQEKNKYAELLEEERANSQQNETRIGKLEKANEKLQLSRKKTQEALAKTTVLLDEAKIREDARNAQHKCLEKEHTALKDENKKLKSTIKGWEDKHKELSEQIKVYQKSLKELEDSVVLKDHNVEVLSELLSDLDACDVQKGDKLLANGEVAPDKKTAIKNRIKQMMDLSRAQTTLTVVEEERDRFMSKLLNEEKQRKALEEQHQELEHAIASLKGEKSHVENQYKILQQKNEIMVEMYQQKENALQQRLTKEELERRSKENLLSEVGGKAVEAEEQVKVLRQRINEMEEQMKKTEEVYKEQIKEQENKTHTNWVNARNAERALNQEKLESSKLREKLAVLTSQLNERRAPLFRPNSGQPAGPRQGDSYGPSPVSGGAPSPPLMIEGPRRPPSAPVGRRIDPYGPRPPSDPHGRYAENKHISGMDMLGPRSSSPANLDASTQAVDPQIKAEAQAEASTDSPEPGPGSFLASPIRDSPGPAVPGPPPGPGPHDPLLPPGPHIRLPPPGPYRPPRPGPYHLPPGPHGLPPPNMPPPLHGPPLPANGHPGMPPPGPMGEFGPRPSNGHAFHPRPGPGPMDPRGPPPPHFRPPPHHFNSMPPPHGVRGPMGPRPPLPPDMRYPGPRDHMMPPMDLPPGVPPPSAHRDAYGQVPPDSLQNSAGAHSGPGPGPDLPLKQEAPQDSARPSMIKP